MGTKKMKKIAIAEKSPLHTLHIPLTEESHHHMARDCFTSTRQQLRFPAASIVQLIQRAHEEMYNH